MIKKIIKNCELGLPNYTGRDNLESAIRELSKALKIANETCRSAHQIALRKGKDTNWYAFISQSKIPLEKQHGVLV